MNYKINNLNISKVAFRARSKNISKPNKNHNYKFSSEINKQTGFVRDDWFVPQCFISTFLPNFYNKSELAIDIDDEISSKNLEKIENHTPAIVTKSQLMKKYPISRKDINQWIAYGLMEPITLLSREDGRECKSGLIDMSIEKNQRCIDKLIQKRTFIHKELTSRHSSQDANSSQLETMLGIPKEQIEEMYNKGLLKGRVSGADETIIYMNNDINQKLLKKIRDSKAIGTNKACDKYGVSNYDFIRNIHNGKLEPLPAVFIGDMYELKINLSYGNNRKEFYKLIMSTLAQKAVTGGYDNISNSLIIEIMAKIYPEVVELANEIASGNEELLNALKNKNEFEQADKEYKTQSEDNQEDAATTDNTATTWQCPSDKEIALIDEFNNMLFEKIDLNEFIYALKSATKYATLYMKTRNLNNIDNQLVKDAILNYKLNHHSSRTNPIE